MKSALLKKRLKNLILDSLASSLKHIQGITGVPMKFNKRLPFTQKIKISLDVTQRTQLIQYLKSQYEPHIVKLAQSLLRPGDLVIDVGAHVGYFSLYFSHCVGERGQVISFEPFLVNFDRLKFNVEQNGLKNVTLVNKALSNKVGTSNLQINQKNDGGHSVCDKAQENSCAIEVSTFDKELMDQGLKKVRFVKMDVEGHEMSCLEGMKGFLSSEYAPDFLIIEVSKRNLEQRQNVFRFMSTYNYKHSSYDFLTYEGYSEGGPDMFFVHQPSRTI